MNTNTFQILAKATEASKPLRGPLTMRHLKEIGDEKWHKLIQLQITWANMWGPRLPRETRMSVWSKVVGRPLKSSLDLTYAEVFVFVKLLEGNGDNSKNFKLWLEELLKAEGIYFVTGDYIDE